MQDQFGGNAELSGPELIAVLAFYGFILVVVIAIQILICWLLSRLQSALPQQFRRHSPGQAYLMLIPLFNFVWMFIYPQGLSDGYAQFFNSQGINKGDCNKQLALWWAICVVASLIPCIGLIPAFASFVLMIMFFVKMNELRTQVLGMSNQMM